MRLAALSGVVVVVVVQKLSATVGSGVGAALGSGVGGGVGWAVGIGVGTWARKLSRVVVVSVDEIGDPKKSSGHYKVSKSVLLTLYSV